MLQKPLLVLSLLGTFGVALVTVHLEVRARLRTYDLASARERIVHLEQSCAAVRLRVEGQWSPERVRHLGAASRAARELWRRQVAEARERSTGT